MNYFYKYMNGDKWIQINGEGNDPKNCKISWDCSENNIDIHTVMIQKRGRSPLYNWVKFDDPKIVNDIYTQVLKISPLIRDGYKCVKHNTPHIDPPLSDPIIPENETKSNLKVSIKPESKVNIKNEENKSKISISKSELAKSVNVGSESGESGYALIPTVWDGQKKKKQEDVTVESLTQIIENGRKELEKEISKLYD